MHDSAVWRIFPVHLLGHGHVGTSCITYVCLLHTCIANQKLELTEDAFVYKGVDGMFHCIEAVGCLSWSGSLVNIVIQTSICHFSIQYFTYLLQYRTHTFHRLITWSGSHAYHVPISSCLGKTRQRCWFAINTCCNVHVWNLLEHSRKLNPCVTLSNLSTVKTILGFSAQIRMCWITLALLSSITFTTLWGPGGNKPNEFSGWPMLFPSCVCVAPPCHHKRLDDCFTQH